jgi:hypothetical protein
MSHIYASPSPPWYKRLPLVAVALVLAALLVALTGQLLNWWAILPTGGSAGASGNVSVSYATESGENATQGTVDSPLKVTVNIPWSKGTQDTIVAGVFLRILDENNNPAVFGTSAVTTPLALKPTFDVAVWNWDGSVPSVPGKYHIQVTITALYNTARNATLDRGSPDFVDPDLEAVADTGDPLTSGFVFAQNANLWLLSTDRSKQRRLTFFPEFYEYADKPQWSPDGSRIAFTYSPTTDPSLIPSTDIWQISPGSPPKPLVTHQGDESLLDPSWSSDGKYIYFTVDTSAAEPITGTSYIPGTDVRIDRFDLATGAREQVMDSAQLPNVEGPGADLIALEYVPTSDPQAIAPLQQMVRVSSDGKTRSIIVPPNSFQNMYAPVMSPDGKWVAFAATNVPPDNAVVTPIVPPNLPTSVPPIGVPVPTITPGTSGDGLDLFALLGLDAKPAQAHGLPWDLFLVPVAGGTPIRLTRLDEDQPYVTWTGNNTINFMGVTGLYQFDIDANGYPTTPPYKLHDGAPHGGLSWHQP